MFPKVALVTWLGEQNKGRQIDWESFRCPSSEFRGQFSFGAKRFWSAMRLRINLKHAVLRCYTTAFFND
jgi:hypothetical protein